MSTRTIFKYSLHPDDKHQVRFAGGNARVVHVATQLRHENGPEVWGAWHEINVWVEHEPDNGESKIVFATLPTGQRFGDEIGTYCGSAHDGPYVWHVYAHIEER